MKRLAVAIVVLLLAALNARALSSAAASHPVLPQAAAGPVPMGPPLQPFVATGLPAPYTLGVPQHVHIPAGYTLKHKHPGNRYVFIISGNLQITDAQGTRTYGPGMFFWEPAWRVHTVHVLRDVEAFFLTFVPPGYTQRLIIPVK